MKRFAKLFGHVLLGALLSLIAYWLLLAALYGVRSLAGGPEELYIKVSFMALLSAGLFVGSMLTGYLSRPYLSTGFGLILVSPGLYPALTMIAVNAVMVYIVKDAPPLPFPENLYLLGTFLSWAIFSWAGTRLGYGFGETKTVR